MPIMKLIKFTSTQFSCHLYQISKYMITPRNFLAMNTESYRVQVLFLSHTLHSLHRLHWGRIKHIKFLKYLLLFTVSASAYWTQKIKSWKSWSHKNHEHSYYIHCHISTTQRKGPSGALATRKVKQWIYLYFY